MTNVDQYVARTGGKRYQVQVRSGQVWESMASYDAQSEAFRQARDNKRTGYHTRVVDTRSGAIIPVPR